MFYMNVVLFGFVVFCKLVVFYSLEYNSYMNEYVFINIDKV